MTLEVVYRAVDKIKAEKKQITEEERSARYASTSHSEDPMDINKMTDTLEPEETGVGGLQRKDQVDVMDINKMTDTLEPEETGVGGLQLPGKHQFIFRPSERVAISVIHFQFHLRTPKASSMMASIDEDVEKSSLADQEDVGCGKVKSLKKNDLLDMLVPRMLR
ncbi:hypothetical protein Tco_0748738 [Tanacetum coccineum]|uniref:Uncharacterized protein n=1 Tax=Tanacetum coccineum TaxID=301880 RepID=A0ABQ4YZF6_9ASTR